MNEQEEAWPIIRAMPIANAEWVITAADIESYSWSDQTIRLTRVASETQMSRNLECFVVTWNGVPVYGGIFLVPPTAMSIRFPVIYHYYHTGGQVDWKIRPAHNGDVYPFGSFPPDLKARIEIPEIRDYFASLGKLIP